MIYHGTAVTLCIKCIILLSLSFDADGLNRVKRGYCSTRTLDIPNGDYYLRSGNSVVKFWCNHGFELYGTEQIVCFGSTWSNDPPMCISNTCQKIEETTTLRVSGEYSGAVLTFTCVSMYKLEGSKKLICDGTNWSGQAPTCKPWDPPLACDFESSDLCGWSQHDKDDQDWRWNSGRTSTSRTGPRHDHTLGEGSNGHYMFFETSSPTRTGHKSALLSPLYPAAYSRHKCFSFWYHILGVGDIGDLELFFKPEISDSTSLTHVFHVNEDGGDVWHEETISVTQQTQSFQVMIVATRGTSYRSDFAIDDVKLSDCSGTIAPKNTTFNSGTVPTQTTIQTTPNLVATTRKLTTTKKHDKTQKMTTLSPKTTKTLTAIISPKTTKTLTTILSPKTTKTLTTILSPKTTKTGTTVTSHVPKASKVTIVKTTTTQKHTQSKTQTVTRIETKYYSNNTIKPIINPNVPVHEAKVESRDATATTKYIIIGVGVFAAVAIVIVAGMYCYRRQGTSRSSKECLSATNPVYRVMAGEEAAVQFAADDNEYEDDY